MKTLKHNPEELNDLLEKINKKVHCLAHGQFWGVLYLKYWPHADEKLVANIVKFCEECTHEYVNCSEATQERPTFEQWQKHTQLSLQLKANFNLLFWGDYNENRQSVNEKLWLPLNRCAITLTEVVGLIKGEFLSESI